MTRTNGQQKNSSRWRRACLRAADICALAADATGHLAAICLLVLTVAIILGITLRWVGIDNSWTFDLDLFALVWTAFTGAVLTSLRDQHVTAGIALEHMLGSRGTILSALRFVIICGFLIVLTISGYHQARVSLLTHKTTLDIVQWPVWVAQAALVVGAALWAVAETGKFLRRLAGEEHDLSNTTPRQQQGDPRKRHHQGQADQSH